MFGKLTRVLQGCVGSFEVDVDGVWEAYKAAIGGLEDV